MTAIDFHRFFQKSAPRSSDQPYFESVSVDRQVSAIAAQKLNMIYETGGQQYQALHNVNLNIQKGAIHLLMGPSGSGKTTLLSILAGLLTPSNGGVRLLGEDITQLSAANLAAFRLQHIGFIFQGFNLFPALTALENVEIAFQLKGFRGRAATQEAIDLLDQVGLGDRLHRRPQDLSGGQKQRVAIARALVGNPALIMADEPTAALDSQNGHAVIELLRTLAKENDRTVLIVTHDPRIVDVADEVTYLEDGKIQQSDFKS